MERRKSKKYNHELKLDLKDLKGFSMEFEKIYDECERDMDCLDLSRCNSSNLYNFDNVNSNENKIPFKSRKSCINPFSPKKKNSYSNSNTNSCDKKNSCFFNSNMNFPQTPTQGEVENPFKDKSEDIVFEKIPLKTRANSILRMLENTFETRKSSGSLMQ